MAGEGLFGLPQAAFIRRRLLVHPLDEDEFPGGGRGGLNGVQVLQVLAQQFPQSRVRLLLQAGAVEFPVLPKGLLGVQGQQFQVRLCLEQRRERLYPQPDRFHGQNGEVIWVYQKKYQLLIPGSKAVGIDPADPHELPSGLPLFQPLFLLSIHQFNPHS